jgi:hypothetical protein
MCPGAPDGKQTEEPKSDAGGEGEMTHRYYRGKPHWRTVKGGRRVGLMLSNR